MNSYQIWGLSILAIFYGAYLFKMVSQRKRGIQTNHIGKGKKDIRTQRIEKVLGIISVVIVLAEAASILKNAHWKIPGWAVIPGLMLASLGTLIFISAMWTMRDSWRAGIPEDDTTEIVTEGLFRFSRNPAFLGFDLTYIGIFIAFDNPLLLAITVSALLIFHLQIQEEEKFLLEAFGQDYLIYREQTGRYFLFF